MLLGRGSVFGATPSGLSVLWRTSRIFALQRVPRPCIKPKRSASWKSFWVRTRGPSSLGPRPFCWCGHGGAVHRVQLTVARFRAVRCAWLLSPLLPPLARRPRREGEFNFGSASVVSRWREEARRRPSHFPESTGCVSFSQLLALFSKHRDLVGMGCATGFVSF